MPPSEILGYVGYALSKAPSVMVMSGVVASLGGMGSAILQSSLTKHVPHERIGQMLGAFGQSIANVAQYIENYRRAN
jgi:hypothetical protein